MTLVRKLTNAWFYNARHSISLPSSGKISIKNNEQKDENIICKQQQGKREKKILYMYS